MRTWGDITLRFPTADPSTGAPGLELLPTAFAHRAQPPRSRIDEPAARHHPDTGPARSVEPLASAARAGDPLHEPFAGARTLRRSATESALRLRSQQTDDDNAVTTELATGDGLALVHRITRHDGFVRIRTTAVNEGDQPLTLDLLTSFTLTGITPFAADDAPAPGRLVVHRIRSAWSAEARPVSDPVERLGLERPYVNIGTVAERFGCAGSMPAAGWMPFVAVEDTEAGVIWGAQLAAGGPWQLELIRGRDGLAISGGPADRDLGGGRIVLGPGESYEAPEAVVSVVQGGLDELCARLTAAQSGHPRPGLERGLPIQFNEYATTWGNPTHDRVLALADRLQGTGVRYFTVDCGWFSDPGSNWWSSHGDWEPSTVRFPGGLAATARALRERGFVPGLWWEPETTGELSKAYADPEPHVHRDGAPVHVSARRFLDLRRPEVTEPLLDRMAAVLKDFGYLKIDYNANLVAEGAVVREVTAASQDFIRALSARLPHLVIENCSGGGHRISPAYAALTAVSSGSDAFEAREAPVIAANLQRVLLPRQSLVWATVRAEDTESDLVYKLAAGFLGRLCLSGDPDLLDEAGWQRVTEALTLYQRAAPVIDAGISHHSGTRPADAMRNPTGWQSVLRVSADGTQALAVLHAFADPGGSPTVDLPPGHWTVSGALGSPLSVAGTRLRWQSPQPWSGAVALLSC
ncbi:alpha-galactosidase [Streptomyces sp. NBC_01537]|uniref:alpha-galactosidase n=1 Tax=Streptomyces sp. NBC_01537 TaxID=2903896 RepID=UPI003863AEAA